MCQLLGMNCATPTDFTFSFHGFRQRGGRTDVHADGWGLAYYDQDDEQIRCVRETQAAAHSNVATILSQLPIRTRNMMSHIRYATRGEVEPANVHPFQRELWGMPWSFCHNGDVPMAAEQMPRLGRRLRRAARASQQQEQPNDSDNEDEIDDVEVVYQPQGQTDSERVFCAILNALQARFDTQPRLSVLFRALEELCQEIVAFDPVHTIFNFLLTSGPEIMFAYSWPGRRPGGRTWNGLHYIVRQPPFYTASLRDVEDCTIDFRLYTTTRDRVSVVATKPLTYEKGWVEFQRNQLILFQNGIPQVGANQYWSLQDLPPSSFVPPQPHFDDGNAVAVCVVSA